LENELILLVLGAIGIKVLEVIANYINQNTEIKKTIIEERIRAYKEIAKVCSDMRFFSESVLGNKTYSHPEVMISEKRYYEWICKVKECIRDNEVFLDKDIAIEINIFNEYIIDLWNVIGGRSDEEIIQIGSLVESDFSEIYSVIDKHLCDFFNRKIHIKKITYKNTEKVNKEVEISRQEKREKLKLYKFIDEGKFDKKPTLTKKLLSKIFK
jgi:hypothetical protein